MKVMLSLLVTSLCMELLPGSSRSFVLQPWGMWEEWPMGLAEDLHTGCSSSYSQPGYSYSLAASCQLILNSSVSILSGTLGS